MQTFRVIPLVFALAISCAPRGGFLIVPDVEPSARDVEGPSRDADSLDAGLRSDVETPDVAFIDVANSDVRALDASGLPDAGVRDVDSLDAEGPDALPQDVGSGDFFLSLFNTYYWKSVESDFEGPANTTLFDDQCSSIATVSSDFADAICVEGSGLLDDGRVLNFSSRCDCGRVCPTGGIICYTEVDRERFPYGLGNRGNALVPLVSLAVDRETIADGTVLYLQEFDGVVIPRIDQLGGFTHDGCFRADDVGGLIEDDHIDIFAGTQNMRAFLEGVHPTRSRFNARINAARCAHLEE